MLAERVGFVPLRGVDSKELRGFHDPLEPLETLKRQGRDTY